ncbi:MAG: hypothetical protein GX542_05895 [Rhodococcus sp.]|nr:hypothetical protein [Rhodococcus sp. (in: high G+C Gram-positive bacteria)]
MNLSTHEFNYVTTEAPPTPGRRLVDDDLMRAWTLHLKWYLLPVLFIGATLSSTIVVESLAQGTDSEDAIGAQLSALFLATLTISALGQVGLRWLFLNPRIRVVNNADHGPALVVPHRIKNRILGGLGCILAAAAFYPIPLDLNAPSTLLSKLSAGNPQAIVITALIAIPLLLALVRTQYRLVLSPSELRIHHRTLIFFMIFDRETVIAWDEIRITRTARVVENARGPRLKFPTFQISANQATEHRRHGSKIVETVKEYSHITVDATRLTAEPNMLVTLLEHMRDHPADRELLSSHSARLMLTPPPVTQRWAAARKSRNETKLYVVQPTNIARETAV